MEKKKNTKRGKNEIVDRPSNKNSSLHCFFSFLFNWVCYTRRDSLFLQFVICFEKNEIIGQRSIYMLLKT